MALYNWILGLYIYCGMFLEFLWSGVVFSWLLPESALLTPCDEFFFGFGILVASIFLWCITDIYWLLL
jgi:hypothetical protein